MTAYRAFRIIRPALEAERAVIACVPEQREPHDRFRLKRAKLQRITGA